jgi:hypothetical protein
MPLKLNIEPAFAKLRWAGVQRSTTGSLKAEHRTSQNPVSGEVKTGEKIVVFTVFNFAKFA